tara:strand:+ start:1571 stop:2446 length:876 start_codon:yes stop_codon:yes gene_type:complete
MKGLPNNLFNPESKHNVLFQEYVDNISLASAAYINDPNKHYHVHQIEEQFKPLLDKVHEGLKKCLEQLNNDEVFFFACSSVIYKKYYSLRLKERLNTLKESTAEDFIQNELVELKEPSETTHYVSMYDDSPITVPNSVVIECVGQEQYRLYTEKKQQFLLEELNSIRPVKKAKSTKKLAKEISGDISHYIRTEHLVGLRAYLVEKKQISETRHLWIDLKKGHQAFLIAVLRSLLGKGYYKTNKPPTPNELMAICQSSFGISLKLRTAQNTDPTKNPIITKIPDASTFNKQN